MQALPAPSKTAPDQTLAEVRAQPLGLRAERTDRLAVRQGLEYTLQTEMTRRLYPGQFSRKNMIGDRAVIGTVTPDIANAVKEYAARSCSGTSMLNATESSVSGSIGRWIRDTTEEVLNVQAMR